MWRGWLRTKNCTKVEWQHVGQFLLTFISVICAISYGFHVVRIKRRELGLFRNPSMTYLIWSNERMYGARLCLSCSPYPLMYSLLGLSCPFHHLRNSSGQYASPDRNHSISLIASFHAVLRNVTKGVDVNVTIGRSKHVLTRWLRVSSSSPVSMICLISDWYILSVSVIFNKL